jgi:hypothetical protein
MANKMEVPSTQEMAAHLARESIRLLALRHANIDTSRIKRYPVFNVKEHPVTFQPDSVIIITAPEELGGSDDRVVLIFNRDRLINTVTYLTLMESVIYALMSLDSLSASLGIIPDGPSASDTDLRSEGF